LARVLSQPAYKLPLNALSGLLQHEVNIFKSCFTASAIESDAALQQSEAYYRQTRSTIDQHPERLFILLTQPPLIPRETTPADAARARGLANWLMSVDFHAGRANLVTFDLFGLLAESNPAAPDYNMLRAVYRTDAESHPTALANHQIAPQLAEFVTRSVKQLKAARR
jgi:hypothetical protein